MIIDHFGRIEKMMQAQFVSFLCFVRPSRKSVPIRELLKRECVSDKFSTTADLHLGVNDFVPRQSFT